MTDEYDPSDEPLGEIPDDAWLIREALLERERERKEQERGA
jgi:hypothetical protein